MDLLDLIKTRRTIRKYKDKKVPHEVLEKIIEAGRWAPSAHNIQPWKFIAIDKKETIEEIVSMLEKKAGELFSGFNLVMRDSAKNLRETQTIVAIYSDGTISRKFSKLGSPYSEIGDIYEVQSVTNAIQNMLLYSHSIGIGVAWYGMALFCEKEINKILGQSGRLMAIISLGYPKEKEKPKSKRKDLKEICEYIK